MSVLVTHSGCLATSAASSRDGWCARPVPAQRSRAHGSSLGLSGLASHRRWLSALLARRQGDFGQKRWCLRLRGSGRNNPRQCRHLRRLCWLIGRTPSRGPMMCQGVINTTPMRTTIHTQRRINEQLKTRNSMAYTGIFIPAEFLQIRNDDGSPDRALARGGRAAIRVGPGERGGQAIRPARAEPAAQPPAARARLRPAARSGQADRRTA